MQATYSPEDNKLRLYPVSRLDSETYARVKAAGFRWAPQQGLFVAPMWTPEREDLLLELCGEVGDEDTSLVDRAEERAERFEGYSDKREHDAHQAHAAVSAIADGIPLGQPILVGHHSERHARKDAERIENGMRRAVKMWETSKYWEQRAAGAIRHAKYKELPAVRARRIKRIEADLRKVQRSAEHQEQRIRVWSKDLTPEQARYIAGHSNTTDMDTYYGLDKGTMTVEQAKERVISQATAYGERCRSWVQHYENRLAYERAMLGEAGGTVADRTGPEKGGAVRCWVGRGHWLYIQKVNKISVTVLDNWGNGGDNFTRTVPFDELKAVMTAAEVQEKRDTGQLVEIDAHKPPSGFVLRDAPLPEPRQAEPEQETPFDAMKDALRAGGVRVETVYAPQLFPTPAGVARRMVQAADIPDGAEILEPSAGTGRILEAVQELAPGARFFAVEINHRLCEALSQRFATPEDAAQGMCRNVLQADFLECNGNLGLFDRIIMNPPFENGSDIKHIRHALHFLKPGGRLVALCANGPRQNEALKPMADSWEDLPADTFKAEGTGVRAAMLVIQG